MKVKHYQDSVGVQYARGNAQENSNKFVLLLTILAYAFPVLSLMDDDANSSSSVSIYTAPSLAALLFLSLYSFVKISGKERLFFIFTLISGFLIAAATAYRMPFVDPDKVTSYFIVFISFGCILFLTLCLREVQRNLDLVLLATGAFGLLLLVLNPTEYDAGRLTYGASNPIWMGRALGVGALAAVAVAVNRPFLRLPAIGLFLVLSLSVLLTGSRGPFMAIFAGVAVTFGVKRFSNKYWITSVFVYIIIVASIIIIGFFPDYFRALSFGNLNDQSFDYRSSMIQYSIDIILSSKDGIGIGQFYFMGFTYPHNVILESFVEWGWVYGALYSTFIIAGVVCCVLLEKEIFLFPMLAVFEFLNAIVSGDMTSPRLLYGLCLYGWLLLLGFVLKSRAPKKAGLP